jgi:MFS family permease
MLSFLGRTPADDPAAQINAVSAAPVERGTRIFYGWIVVVATFTVLLIAYGIQFSFGVFMHYISADVGWDRGSLSLPYSLYVFIYSALGFASGRLTDRYGPRRVISIGGCLLGVGVMLIGKAHALWQLYIALGFIAACGMSAAYVPCNATVVRWFTIRRGLALSITSSGASFGMFVFPPIATALIVALGWRYAYAVLGLIGFIAIILCAQFIVRDPEQMGLSPDGHQPDPAPAFDGFACQMPNADWTLASARHTTAFWLLTAIFTLTWLVVFMPMVHIVPFALDLGIPQFRAAMTISVIGLAGFVGRLVIGPISDRVGRLGSLGVSLLLQVLAFLGFAFSQQLFPLYTSAALFGLSYGGVSALFPALVGDFFGRLAVGAIVGFIFAVAGAPSALGPLIGGYLFDFTGSYRFAFEISAALNLLALSLIIFLRKPPVASTNSPLV